MAPKRSLSVLRPWPSEAFEAQTVLVVNAQHAIHVQAATADLALCGERIKLFKSLEQEHREKFHSQRKLSQNENCLGTDRISQVSDA